MAKQKATIPLPKRPEPPTLEEMLEDIGKATDDDTVFTLFAGGHSSPSTPSPTKTMGIMSDSYEEPSPRLPSTDSDDISSDIDSCYLKAKKYIETNKHLHSANDNLAEQYEELQKMGQHLKQSIEQLRKETAKIKN